MADDDTGERSGFEKLFQPFDPGEIEVIRWFIQQQDRRVLNQRVRDGEPLAPTAGQGGGVRIEIPKTRAAQGFRLAARPFRFGHTRQAQGLLHDAARSFRGFKLGILRDVDEPRAVANHDFAGVGRDVPGKDLQ